MFTELNKANIFVITIPKEYFGSNNDRDDMKRLAVEVFAIDDKGIFFFDVGWSECDSGHPRHYFDCKVIETKGGWDLKDFGGVKAVGKLELYSAIRHPEFLSAASMWHEYLKETGRKEELKKIAQKNYESQLRFVRGR